jgi:hypothetical protein
LQIEDLTEADLKAYNDVPDLDEAGSGDEEVVVQRAEGPKKRKAFRNDLGRSKMTKADTTSSASAAVLDSKKTSNLESQKRKKVGVKKLPTSDK